MGRKEARESRPAICCCPNFSKSVAVAVEAEVEETMILEETMMQEETMILEACDLLLPECLKISAIVNFYNMLRTIC